jgi:hypothetical protein
MRREMISGLFTMLLVLGTSGDGFALELDMSAGVGAGGAMGATDCDAKSGELRHALVAGVCMDWYFLRWGGVSLGLSTGADFSSLNYRGFTEGLPNPAYQQFGGPAATHRTADTRYNYINFPFLAVGKVALCGTRSVTLRAGGFASYFLGGVSDLTYNPEIGMATGYPFDVYTDGSVDLDDSNTEQWMWGLRLYAGTDVFTRGRISLIPGIQFDMGLTDISIDSVQPLPSKDTFWALTANLGLRYRLY